MTESTKKLIYKNIPKCTILIEGIPLDVYDSESSKGKFDLNLYILSYSLTQFKQDVHDAYMSMFQAIYRPVRPLDQDGRDSYIADKKIFDYFFLGYYSSLQYGDLIKPIFGVKQAYALHYWFTGESSRYLKDLNRNSSAVFNFENNNIEIDMMALYAIFRVLRDRLKGAGVDLRKSGFPKYFKVFNRDSFFRHFVPKIEYMLSKPKLRKGLLANRAHFKYFVRNQESSIKLSKKLTIQQVLEYCNASNSGAFLRYFKNEKFFKKAAQKLYDTCEKNKRKELILKNGYAPVDLKPILRKQRITPKSCLTYLKYLALMSTIQTRMMRPIEINSFVEKKYFYYGYRIMSESANQLGWKVCYDATYCKGIRSRSYVIRVATGKNAVSTKRRIFLNNIEKAYATLRCDEDRMKAAMAFEAAGEYFDQRLKTAELERQYKESARDAYKALKDNNLHKKFESLREVRYNRLILRDKIDSFYVKFSDNKRYKSLNAWRLTG